MTSSSSAPRQQRVEDAELDSFLSRVDMVHSTVKGLVANEVDAAAADLVIEKLQPKPPSPPSSPSSPSSPSPASPSYRPGKGEKDDYAMFCRPCHLEYLSADVYTQCEQCGGALMSRAERGAEIGAKVDALRAARERRHAKKERFSRWKERRSEAARTTDYGLWERWEPSSDDEYDATAGNPGAFAALERDMNERDRVRKEREAEADAEKRRGNELVQRGEYHEAIVCYTRGVQLRRDDMALYTNRALAHLRVHSYDMTIQDCNVVFEIHEWLHQSRVKDVNRRLVVKAHMRRACAYDGLRRYAEALDDVERGLSIVPRDKELLKMRTNIMARRDEHDRANALLTSHDDDGGDDLTMTNVLDATDDETGVMDEQVVVDLHERLVRYDDELCMASFRQHRGVHYLIHTMRAAAAAATATTTRRRKASVVVAMANKVLMNDMCLSEWISHPQGVDVLATALLRGVDADDDDGDSVRLLLQCIARVSERDNGRLHLRQHKRVVDHLVRYIVDSDAKATDVVGAARLLEHCVCGVSNMLLDASLRQRIASMHADTLVPRLFVLLSHDTVASRACGCLGNLVTTGGLRHRVITCGGADMWGRHLDALLARRDSDLTAKYMVLLYNCAIEGSFVELATVRAYTRVHDAHTNNRSSDVGDNDDNGLLLGLLGRMLKNTVIQSSDVVIRSARAYVPYLSSPSSSSSSSNHCEHAIRALAILFAHDEAHAAITGADDVARLVACLDDEKAKVVQGNAALCVSQLARNERVCALLAPTIPPLVRLLHSSELSAQKNSAIALSRLAKSPVHLKSMQESGAMKSLLEIATHVLKK